MVQPQLSVGPEDDPLEREADLMAARVVAQMSSWAPRAAAQHDGSGGDEDPDQRIRRIPTASPMQIGGRNAGISPSCGSAPVARSSSPKR